MINAGMPVERRCEQTVCRGARSRTAGRWEKGKSVICVLRCVLKCFKHVLDDDHFREMRKNPPNPIQYQQLLLRRLG